MTQPVIMTHKRRERKTFRKLVDRTRLDTLPSCALGARSQGLSEDLVTVESQIGVRSVATPATGNRLAMSIAQAVADATLAGPAQSLELLTASIKRGIKLSGLLGLAGQLAHDHRVNALANVQRGWASMTRTESTRQMRWLIEDYANSSSDRTVEVPENT